MAEFSRTYDPAQNPVYFAGQQAHGFADGEFVSVEQMSPTFSSQAGADGESSRTRSRDGRLTIKLTLMQTSAFNDVMAAAHATDRLFGDGVYPFMLEERGGATIVDAPEAWITAAAPVKRGKEQIATEWTIECASGAIYNAGLGG